MNYNEALNYIFSLKTVSLNPSLARISAALEQLSNPQNSLKAIHIAGTNGKGSVASMIAKILEADFHKVGLFVSPYIIDFRERIQINGVYIAEDDLCRLTEQVASVNRKLSEKGIELGQFEFITAVALLYFKEQGCDYLVLETGLGGRFDATNVFDKPICTVITKISYDHTGILGNTLKEIAYEKAGIIKAGVKCVTCEQAWEAFEVVSHTCQQLNAPLNLIKTHDVENVETNLNGTSFIYQGKSFFTSLCGKHQAENAALALEAIRCIDKEVSDRAIVQGLKRVKHPARLEAFNDGKVIVDGAHNPDGAQSLSDFLSEVNFKGNILFGGMKDKNIDEVAKILAPFADKIFTVTIKDNPRAQTAEELKSIFSIYSNNVYAINSYDEAFNLSVDTPLVVCGSLYLAADVRKRFDKTN